MRAREPDLPAPVSVPLQANSIHWWERLSGYWRCVCGEDSIQGRSLCVPAVVLKLFGRGAIYISIVRRALASDLHRRSTFTQRADAAAA